jgi:hypothetical protein
VKYLLGPQDLRGLLPHIAPSKNAATLKSKSLKKIARTQQVNIDVETTLDGPVDGDEAENTLAIKGTNWGAISN